MSISETTDPKVLLSCMVLMTGKQVFGHMSLWGTFIFKL